MELGIYQWIKYAAGFLLNTDILTINLELGINHFQVSKGKEIIKLWFPEAKATAVCFSLTKVLPRS